MSLWGNSYCAKYLSEFFKLSLVGLWLEGEEWFPPLWPNRYSSRESIVMFLGISTEKDCNVILLFVWNPLTRLILTFLTWRNVNAAWRGFDKNLLLDVCLILRASITTSMEDVVWVLFWIAAIQVVDFLAGKRVVSCQELRRFSAACTQVWSLTLFYSVSSLQSKINLRNSKIKNFDATHTRRGQQSETETN